MIAAGGGHRGAGDPLRCLVLGAVEVVPQVERLVDGDPRAVDPREKPAEHVVFLAQGLFASENGFWEPLLVACQKKETGCRKYGGKRSSVVCGAGGHARSHG